VLDDPAGAADHKFKLVAISTNFDVPIAPVPLWRRRSGAKMGGGGEGDGGG
jgi:hypothetical protein